MSCLQTADTAAEQRKHDSIIRSLQVKFFDYAAMIAAKGTPKVAAASVKMLNSTLDMIKSTDNRNIEFTKTVLEDIHTMIDLTQEEIKNKGTENKAQGEMRR